MAVSTTASNARTAKRMVSYRRAGDLGMVVAATLSMPEVVSAFESRFVTSTAVLSLIVATLTGALVCQFDARGTIIGTNKAWRSFAAESQSEDEAAYLERNYLDICRASERDAERPQL